jgi:hypothetical protein
MSIYNVLEGRNEYPMIEAALEFTSNLPEIHHVRL